MHIVVHITNHMDNYTQLKHMKLHKTGKQTGRENNVRLKGV